MNEQFEFKSAASGAIALDELQGIVECFVAGIGNKDSVGDIVVTGAFAKSLTRRKPRVVWAHSWNDPIGKVLEMYEVPPGDPRLPAKMKNAGIGGLYAKVQFNLQSEKGKEAFASVAFFGEEQEWSIGYKTINGAFDTAQQANVLREVELYEVSPVLHGANQLTGTISVKSDSKNHMMPIIPGMSMMGEQLQQPRMIVIAAPQEQEQEQDEPFDIFAEGLAQPLDAEKTQKIQSELSERTGSKVDIVEATDSFIVFRRTTTDGKVSMYRVGYHTPDAYNTFMFGKPEAYSGNQNKPPVQQQIEVKPADESMVPMQPQQIPYRDDDQDEMNTMLGGQVGIGKSAYAHLIEIPQGHIVQAKSMLQPVFKYHNLSTTDSDNGIIVNGSISAQAIDALQTAVKAIGQTIGQSVGNLRTLSQSFNPFAIDGDNDGFAQDGTAFQRPYIPIKKPDMNLPDIGGKNRDSNELLDKPTIRTGKKPTKDPSLLSGTERQEALAAGELQPRTMDDISFLANRRPENEGLAKYWDMSEDGLRAEGQKLVAARRGQTGSDREKTDAELFKLSHEFSRRDAYKQQFGKDFVPPKRTESTGKETFDVSGVRDILPEGTAAEDTRLGYGFSGRNNPRYEKPKYGEFLDEYQKNRSKRGFGSRGDVTPEQQDRIDTSRRRGSDIASGRAQILADNMKNLSDEDKDFIRENGIVSFLLQDGNGPLTSEWGGENLWSDRIGDLLPEGDWSTDSKLQADAEDIFASYEEGFYGQLDKEFADLVNPADLDTPKAKRDRQRAAGQGEMFAEDDFDKLSADEQDLVLEQGRDSARGLASRGEGNGPWGSNMGIDPDDDELDDSFIEEYIIDHVGDGEVEFDKLESFNNRSKEPLSDSELKDLFDRYQSDDDAIRAIASDEIASRFFSDLVDDQYDYMVDAQNSKYEPDYEDYERSRGGFDSRGASLTDKPTPKEELRSFENYLDSEYGVDYMDYTQMSDEEVKQEVMRNYRMSRSEANAFVKRLRKDENTYDELYMAADDAGDDEVDGFASLSRIKPGRVRGVVDDGAIEEINLSDEIVNDLIYDDKSKELFVSTGGGWKAGEPDASGAIQYTRTEIRTYVLQDVSKEELNELGASRNLSESVNALEKIKTSRGFTNDDKFNFFGREDKFEGVETRLQLEKLLLNEQRKAKQAEKVKKQARLDLSDEEFIADLLPAKRTSVLDPRLNEEDSRRNEKMESDYRSLMEMSLPELEKELEKARNEYGEARFVLLQRDAGVIGRDYEAEGVSNRETRANAIERIFVRKAQSRDGKPTDGFASRMPNDGERILQRGNRDFLSDEFSPSEYRMAMSGLDKVRKGDGKVSPQEEAAIRKLANLYKMRPTIKPNERFAINEVLNNVNSYANLRGSGFASRGDRLDVPGKNNDLGKWLPEDVQEFLDSNDDLLGELDAQYYLDNPGSPRPGARDHSSEAMIEDLMANPEKYGFAKDFRKEAIEALKGSGADRDEAERVADYWIENDAIHDEYLKEADGDSLYAMALAYDNYLDAAADNYNERQRGFGSRGDTTPEMRPYDEFTSKEKEKLFEQVQDDLYDQGRWDIVKNVLEEGGFDYDEFLQDNPEIHPDFVDFGDAGDMGLASRGSKPPSAAKLQELISDRLGAREDDSRIPKPLREYSKALVENWNGLTPSEKNEAFADSQISERTNLSDEDFLEVLESAWQSHAYKNEKFSALDDELRYIMEDNDTSGFASRGGRKSTDEYKEEVSDLLDIPSLDNGNSSNMDIRHADLLKQRKELIETRSRIAREIAEANGVKIDSSTTIYDVTDDDDDIDLLESLDEAISEATENIERNSEYRTAQLAKVDEASDIWAKIQDLESNSINLYGDDGEGGLESDLNELAKRFEEIDALEHYDGSSLWESENEKEKIRDTINLVDELIRAGEKKDEQGDDLAEVLEEANDVMSFIISREESIAKGNYKDLEYDTDEIPSVDGYDADYPEDRLFSSSGKSTSGFASRGSSRFDTVETPNSSAIEAVHYDRKTRELHVAFKPGQTGGEARYYTYSDVSPDYFDNEVAGSSSIGRVINDVKRNHDVEITKSSTIDAINGRGDSESDDMLEQVLQLRDEIGSLSESDLTDLADEARRSLARDGFDGYELSDEYGEPNSLVQERMIQIFESRSPKPASAGKKPSKIQDIDVRRSAALYGSYYDPNTQELVVTFKDKDGNAGGSYIYEGVTSDEAQELASSSSKGKVINKIKASKSVRRASGSDRTDRDADASAELGEGSYEAQIDSHWNEIGPDEQSRYFTRAVDSAINAGSGTSADEITADAKARAYDDRQIAMMEMQAESLGMGYRNVDVGSSAALNRVQYDPDKRELRVEYRGRDGKGTGEFYIYENVPQSVVDDLEASDSRGATLRRVRDDFDFRREEAIPQSAFYSMGEPAERSNPKITNRTNENGFYLDENGKATNYNKRAYTTGDIQKVNARRNGRDGFASRASINESSTGQRIVPSRMHSDDRESLAEITDPEERKQRIDELIEFYGPKIFAKPAAPRSKRVRVPMMPDVEGMDEADASDALDRTNDELLDFINEREKVAREILGEREYLRQFSGAVPYIEELSKNHDGGIEERSAALEQAIDRAASFAYDVNDITPDGFASRGKKLTADDIDDATVNTLNDWVTKKEIYDATYGEPSEDLLDSYAQGFVDGGNYATDEDIDRFYEDTEFTYEDYADFINGLPDDERKKLDEDIRIERQRELDNEAYWERKRGRTAGEGFASRGGTSKLDRDYQSAMSVDTPLDDNASIFNALDRALPPAGGGTWDDSAEYKPSINTVPWSKMTTGQKRRVAEDMIDNNRAYFNQMDRDGATVGEIDKEIGRIYDGEAKANLIALERNLKQAKDDYYESARKMLERSNPGLSEDKIEEMLADLGLSLDDFEKLFAKNMDAFEMAALATDLENKRRKIVGLGTNPSTPKTGGDRPKVDPLSVLGGYSDGDVFGLTPRGFSSRGESGVKRKTKEEVFAEMQKQLIAALEDSENLGKWKLPWRRTGMPENGTTGRKYSGSNWFFLSVIADARGFDSNKWATYNQWQGLGGQVRKGEKGTTIFVPMFIKGKEKADGTSTDGRIMFKVATVFNLKQIDGMPDDFDKKEILPEAERVADLEKTISEIPAVIKNGGDKAFFQPSGDFIQVPDFENFNDARSYYSTVAHELMHWTGGNGRLGREQMGTFGTPEYAYEELVAEIASAMFMASHNIEPNIQENHGPYLASWLKKLKDDPEALEKAMTDAQKAVNYVLDISPNAKSKFSNGEKAEFETPEIAVVGNPAVSVQGLASRGDWPTSGGYEPSEFDMRTALSQIGRGNLMAISGTRAKKRNNEMVLPVNRNQQVIVGYDGGSDTYFVRAEQIITSGKDKGKTRVLGQWDNVYADELGETSYQASLKPSMLSDDNKVVWAQAFDHPQTGSLLDENGRVYENGLASGGDSMDPDELDAMDWAYDAAQDYMMEQEDMMPEGPSPEDGFASRMNLSREEKNEIIAIARRMGNRFTTSVVGQYDRNGELSDKQWDALNRMTLRKQGDQYVRNTRGLASRGDKKRPRVPKTNWTPEDRQSYVDGDRLRSKKRPGKRRNGPDASEYGFGSRGEPIDILPSDIVVGEESSGGRSWGFEPIVNRAARRFGGKQNMTDEQLAAELGVPVDVARKMRKPGARTRDVYLLDRLRIQVDGDRNLWGVGKDPLSYYDESGKPIDIEANIPDTGDMAPDVPGTRAPRSTESRNYLDASAVLEEVGIDRDASRYSIIKENIDIFGETTWKRILSRGITAGEVDALLKAKKSKKKASDLYGDATEIATSVRRTDSMPLADVFSNQAFDSLRGKRGFPQQVVEAIAEVTGRRPSISTAKNFINNPRSSGKATGRNPLSMSPAQIQLLLEKLGISSEEFDKFRSE